MVERARCLALRLVCVAREALDMTPFAMARDGADGHRWLYKSDVSALTLPSSFTFLLSVALAVPHR